jgi:MFS family permease
MKVDAADGTDTPGPWSPLRHPTFRSLWFAILVGNVGTWIHEVAAAWIMAERTGSPFLVAAVQAAATLPMVLFAVLAGTLADIIDRRRYLIAVQLWMFFVASTLALTAHWDVLTPGILIGLTFAMGTGAAMAMPAQQAITPELIPRHMLGAAVALGSLSMNIARSIGPALGGLVMAWSGASLAFALNAASFLGLVIVLIRWQRPGRDPNSLPPEAFGSALRAGLRYAARASMFRAVLVKAGLFFVFASAFSALLPIVAKRELGVGAGIYGLLLGCIGAGAVLGAMLLPRIRRASGPDRLVWWGTLTYATCLIGLALVRNTAALYAVCALAGFAWIAIVSSLHVASQTAVPGWVRARALALYIMVFSAGLAAGSMGWGGLAQMQGTATALLLAALGTIVAGVLGLRFSLGGAASADTTPSGHWPTPIVAAEMRGDRGPVMVTVEYSVPLQARSQFLSLMSELGQVRRRNGAVEWGVAEEASDPGVYFEYFIDASWFEHLRQHERVSGDDRKLQERIVALLKQPPRVRHFVGGGPDASLVSLPADRPESPLV